MSTTTDALTGTTFDGRYRVMRRIGSGGMAVVYEAEDLNLQRPVALKVLDRRYGEDGAFVERFLHEASAAARLSHANIAQVYDRGVADGSYYIAMEYVDGRTLKDIVSARGALAAADVIGFARQALDGLRYAHRNGVVHRDVKPHNMLVTPDGRLKIVDFGIARAGAGHGLTEAGSIVGTAQYLSPEQARGEHVAAGSDLYSLGVTMFELATGRVPFDGDSPVNVALRHVNEAPPRPSDFNPAVDPALEAVIVRAMSKDPALRYTTADEMLSDLDRAAQGVISADTRAMTQVLPTAAPAAAAAYTQAMPAAPPPVAAKKKKPKWPWILAALALLAVAAFAAFTIFGGDTPKVPNVEGLGRDAATKALTEAGYVVGDVEFEFHDEAAKGIVIDQSPEGGDELDEGETVDLVISKGPQPVGVPDVTGMTRAAAEDALEKAGFAVQASEEFSDTVKKGTVIRQDPAAGADVEPGSTVTIVISKGADTVVVPNVVGKDVDEAQAILEGLELTVNIREEDSVAAEGTVLSQNPATGARLDKGASVDLVIASGYNEVPNLIGATEDEATDILAESGFEIDVTVETDPAFSAEGEVTSQTPAAGGRGKIGSTVEVIITKAP